MIIRIEHIIPLPNNQVAVAFSVDNPPTKNFYQTAPMDIAALQGMTPADRRTAIVAAMRAVAIPPAAPNLGQGLQPGDQVDIG